MIEQAVYGNFGDGYRFVARSPGFRDEWFAEAQRLCAGFGERPAGVACPAAVFAQPFGRRHVAIVQVADQGCDDAGRPGALGFYVLIVPRPLYRDFGGDPFLLADHFPPPWQARAELPSLPSPADPPPSRAVEQVRRVLKRPDGPNLLGGAQILVDGGRVAFVRSQPDPTILRDLWTLLPTSTRWELWPATFAFGNALRFHVLATPKAEGEDYAHYHIEEQAGDYPEGRYELALQTAAEAGDERELQRLFGRRSQAETMRLALYILGAAVLVLLAAGLFNPRQPVPPASERPPSTVKQTDGSRARLDLPPADQFAPLGQQEREKLTRQLGELLVQAGARLPPEFSTQPIVLATVGGGGPFVRAALLHRDVVVASPEAMLAALDHHLGTPDPGRNPGPLRDHGPFPRQLRVMLWKHRVAAYDDLRLNVFELVEKLQAALPARGKLGLK